MGIKRKLFVTVFLAIAAMPLTAQSTVAHEIVQGNTIYSLAKEYGSTVEAIYEANPNIGVRSLVIGETLIIPVPKDTLVNENVAPQVKDQPDTQAQEYEVYLVKRKDTPESLTASWGLPNLEAFYSLNPDARIQWSKGMALVKPANAAAVAFKPQSTNRETNDTAGLSNEIRVACILPFFLDQYVNEGPGRKRSELSFSYRQGVELAINEFTRDSSLSIDVQFFDSMNQRDTVQGIVNELIKNKPDLVLGPMYSSRLMQLKGTPLEEFSVNLISKQESVRNSGLWNDVVSEDVFWSAIKQYHELPQQQDTASDSTIVPARKLLVVGINSGKSARASRYLTNELEAEDYLLIEGDNSWIHNEQLATLDSTISYDLVITENDPAYILDVLRNLRSVNVDYHWYTHEYQALDNGLVSSVFSRETVHMFTANFTDYDSEESTEFIRAFRSRFERHPDRMAIEGYDNAKFHLLRLTQGTTSWRGIRKGFSFEDASRENSFVEMRSFRNLRWELQQ
jgi:LysM repeat protein